MSWTESHEQSISDKYNLTVLGIDQAWLNVTNWSGQNLTLYQLSKDCIECPYVKNKDVSDLESGHSIAITVPTKFPISYRLETSSINEIILENDTGTLYCRDDASMGEFGVYEMVARDKSCEIQTLLEPVSIFLPFLIPIFFYFALGVIVVLVQKLRKPLCQLIGMKSEDVPSITTLEGPVGSSTLKTATSTPPPARPRLRSLDTFRGICIVIMIFVNDGGAGYYFIEHATWDGLYIGDLVFPWFLWIMGVCIPVSIKSQVKRDTPKLVILKNIIIRSLKLIAIGIIINTKGGPVEWGKLRLPGVLQRFGICYLVVASTVLMCSTKDFVNNRKAERKSIAMIQDVVFIWKGWIVCLAAVVLHTCLTFLLHVPGCPTGYLGPGGLHKGNAYPGECIGGAAGYIDRKILTLDHVYQWPTAKETYESTPYDPEGILGTLTAIFTVWLGVQAGLTLQVYPNHRSRLVRWTVWAVVTGALGAALSGAEQTGGIIPLNKNLWSLSFVFVVSCFALILLITLYVVIDVLKLWSGTPFFEPGMNSILLYIGHLIAGDLLPWHFKLKRMNTHFKMLVESLWGTSLWVIYAIYLFHKKFFWSL